MPIINSGLGDFNPFLYPSLNPEVAKARQRAIDMLKVAYEGIGNYDLKTFAMGFADYAEAMSELAAIDPKLATRMAAYVKTGIMSKMVDRLNFMSKVGLLESRRTIAPILPPFPIAFPA